MPQTQPFLYGIEGVRDNGITAKSADSGSYIVTTFV